MRALIMISLLVIAPTVKANDECPDLGVGNSYLERLFCEQIRGIISQAGSDRSSWPSGSEPSEDAKDAPWRKIGMLEEAYSRDPKSTLALIQRIKAAGGLEVID